MCNFVGMVKKSDTKKIGHMKYICISENAPQEKFVEIGGKVMEGKAKRAYYVVEGNTGYFYYKLI